LVLLGLFFCSALATDSSEEYLDINDSVTSSVADSDQPTGSGTPEGARPPLRRTNSYTAPRRVTPPPQLRRTQSTVIRRSGFELPTPKTRTPPVSDLTVQVDNLRAAFKNMEIGKTDDQLLNDTFCVFSQIYKIDPPKIVTMDAFAQAVQVEYKHPNIESARAFIKEGKYRGFTTKTYEAYILRESQDQAEHDGLHELVHVASGVNTKIFDWGADWQEVFTEFFTQMFRPMMKPPVPDFEAYHNPKEFGRELARWIGVAPMHKAFLQNEGMDAVIKAFALKSCVGVPPVAPRTTPYAGLTLIQKEEMIAAVFKAIVWSDPKTQGQTAWKARPLFWLNKCCGGQYFKNVNWRLESTRQDDGTYLSAWSRFV